MAVLFAVTYPDRTSALVLVNTFARLLRDVDYGHGYPLDRVPTFLARFEELWERRFVDFMAPSVAHDERFWRWYARYERWPWDRGPRGRFAPRCSRSTCVTSCRLCSCPFSCLKVRDADFALKPNSR